MRDLNFIDIILYDLLGCVRLGDKCSGDDSIPNDSDEDVSVADVSVAESNFRSSMKGYGDCCKGLDCKKHTNFFEDLFGRLVFRCDKRKAA